MRLIFSKNKKLKQILILLSATGFNIIAGVGINFILAKILGKEKLGDYSFILNIFVFSQVVFNFGFFQSLGRLIAISNSKYKTRYIYGAGLLIVLSLYLLMSLCLILYALYSSNIQAKEISKSFLLVIPFGFIYLLTNYNELLLQGDNRIGLLSQSRFLPRLIYIVILLFFFFRNRREY